MRNTPGTPLVVRIVVARYVSATRVTKKNVSHILKACLRLGRGVAKPPPLGSPQRSGDGTARDRHPTEPPPPLGSSQRSDDLRLLRDGAARKIGPETSRSHLPASKRSQAFASVFRASSIACLAL
jgi:hypothetical protein